MGVQGVVNLCTFTKMGEACWKSRKREDCENYSPPNLRESIGDIVDDNYFETLPLYGLAYNFSWS